MKNKKNNFYKVFVGLIFLICVTSIFITSCGVSIEDLTEEVKISMEQTWIDEGITGITIKDLTLVHKSGNEYAGILETQEPNGNFKYTVEVIYDGENIRWEIAE